MLNNSLKLSIIKRRKAPQEIAWQIRSRILEGTLESGCKLPTEQVMTESLGVSRQTLREALRILEVQGLLKVKAGQGGGAFISDVAEDTTFSALINFLHNKNITLNQLWVVRKLIEPYIATEAVEKASKKQIHDLEIILSKNKFAVSKNDIMKVRELEVLFHTKIVALSENPLLIFIYRFISHILLDIKEKLNTDDKFSASVLNMHEKILQAFKNRDKEAIKSKMIEDIDFVMGKLQSIANQHSIKNITFISI